MIIIDGRLDRDSSMLRPSLLQWTTEYSHCTIRQVILTMAKSSGLAQTTQSFNSKQIRKRAMEGNNKGLQTG
jgi:hypothetical protein